MNASDKRSAALRPTPKGLENNDAFREYQSLDRKTREALKVSAPEVPDLQKEMQTLKRLEALQQVVTDQLEVIRDQKRQLDLHKRLSKIASAAVLDAVHGRSSPEDALRLIAGEILGAAGIDPATHQPSLNPVSPTLPDLSPTPKDH